jgi:hypothetical protein
MARIFIAVAFFAILVVSIVTSSVCAWRIHQNQQYLVLADDASTPAQKAKYLDQYIKLMEAKRLPEYGAFVFQTERNKTVNQMEVVRSLWQRCDDLSRVNPAELGYAQGMQQITGQEFDHALDNVSSVLGGAMWVQYGWLCCYGWILGIVAFCLSLIPCFMDY